MVRKISSQCSRSRLFSSITFQCQDITLPVSPLVNLLCTTFSMEPNTALPPTHHSFCCKSLFQIRRKIGTMAYFRNLICKSKMFIHNFFLEPTDLDRLMFYGFSEMLMYNHTFVSQWYDVLCIDYQLLCRLLYTAQMKNFRFESGALNHHNVCFRL